MFSIPSFTSIPSTSELLGDFSGGLLGESGTSTDGLNYNAGEDADFTKYYNAYSSLYSQEDFSGLAHITDSSGGSNFNIDFIIQDVSFTLSEHVYRQQHLGDSFHITTFGKSPMIAEVSGTLLDINGGFGRANLINYYRSNMRVSVCARTGKYPAVVLPDMSICGPMSSLSISMSSNSQGTCLVFMKVVVIKLILGQKVIDYACASNDTTFTLSTEAESAPAGYEYKDGSLTKKTAKETANKSAEKTTESAKKAETTTTATETTTK